MNKTIIININGIVFHIEEDAYEILKNYMTEVKRHFSSSADSLEITTDIENRIAEMFSELLERESKQVIVDQDVKLVIEQMGTVSDFENAENNDNAGQSTYSYNNMEGRRLFRDPDDHLVAGVCAGIANYFDMNPVWVRLIFALCICIGGSGLLLYCILWIVVPKAITRADRMAMKGEKQNLQGFKKNFEEELNSLRGNFTNFGNETRPLVYKARDFFGDFFHHLGIFIGGAGKVFIKMIGGVLLLTCFAACVALILGVIAFIGFDAGNPHAFFPFTIIANEHADNVYLCAFFAAFIPMLSIILVILKGVFNVGNIGKSTGTVFLVIWLCSIGMLIYYAVKISSQFRESASFTETVNLKATKNNTYYLKLNDIKYFSHDDSVRLDIKDHFRNMIVRDNNSNGFHNDPRSVTINIEKSDVQAPVLEESFSANGGNYEDALFNASNTRYIFAQQDSVLKFDYTLRKLPNISWHAEEVNLTLKLPLNSKVVIEQRLDNYVQGINLYDCKVANKQEDANTATFVMTEKGLQCKVDTIVTAKKDSLKADSTR